MTIAIGVMMFFADPARELHPRSTPLSRCSRSRSSCLSACCSSPRASASTINRSYVYFAILFSLGVEALNFRRQANLEREQAAMGPRGV